MTKAELIKALQKLDAPKDTEVCLYGGFEEWVYESGPQKIVAVKYLDDRGIIEITDVEY